MNIFFLDRDPVVAARMLHDKHVVKMVLETAQILSTVMERHGVWNEDMYRPSHQNHPSVLWAGDSWKNTFWLQEHGLALADEYTYRYGKEHRSLDVIKETIRRSPIAAVGGKLSEPPQAMPDEFKVPGNAVAAYQKYYLGRKVEQSKWTRRPVPNFVEEFMKKHVKSEILGVPVEETLVSADAPADPKMETAVSADAPAEVQETERALDKPSPIGTRGPKGVAVSAKISLLAKSNPKRPGSKAHTIFSNYRDGMTIKEFMDAAGDQATVALTYDVAHGFIAIEGFTPKKTFKPKERAPKVAKEPKAPRKVKGQDERALPTAESVDSEVVEETIE